MKSNKKVILALLTVFIASTTLSAQTFTMGKKCRGYLESAQAANSQESYDKAVELFDFFRSKCSTKDAKEKGAYGKAEALNGLKRYNEALTEANKAIEITKNRSLNGHFQKAVALSGLGNTTEAKGELDQIISLTEMNENSSQRASNYALMSSFYQKQNQLDSAQAYLNKAKTIDPSNANYLIQEGSMYSAVGNYDAAFGAYSKAEAMNPNSLELCQAQTNMMFKQMKEKYGTTNSQELKNKMNTEEKNRLCSVLKKAKGLGYSDMNKDLFIAMVCK